MTDEKSIVNGARKTGFDRYFEKRMGASHFAATYEEARARIDAIAAVVRQLDATREQQGISKAELARRIGVRPESVRRLFSGTSPNPTLKTVVAVARALHLRIILETEPSVAEPDRHPAALAS